MKNQQFYKTLFNLKILTSIKIIKYYKVNGIRLMTQYDYLNKLSSVVENKTKSKSAEKNKIKNSRQPLITRTIHIKEMIKQNLKNSYRQKDI